MNKKFQKYNITLIINIDSNKKNIFRENWKEKKLILGGSPTFRVTQSKNKEHFYILIFYIDYEFMIKNIEMSSLKKFPMLNCY